jgi:hypothetical protein
VPAPDRDERAPLRAPTHRIHGDLIALIDTVSAAVLLLLAASAPSRQC